MLLDQVVRTSATVAGSAGRLAKVAAIAELLREVESAELPVAVAFLSGELTQRQIGVGYAALVDLLGSRAAYTNAGEAGADGAGSSGTGSSEAGSSEAGPDGSGSDGTGPDGTGSRGTGSDGTRPGGATGLAVPPAVPALTLAVTDAALGEIGGRAGAGSQAERRALLAGLLGQATAAEREFLIRLLGGDLRQGALAGIMTEAIATAAEVPAAAVRRAYQVGGSLAGAARAALSAPGDPVAAEAALAAVALQVGQPLRPMLAATAPDIATALEKISPAGVEWKIDGIRIQVHRSGSDVRVFTRTLDDITGRVPEIVAAALALDATAVVLDGEAVALFPDGRPRPFQVTSARTASSGDVARLSEQTPLTPFFFDLLHLDGTDLLDAPAADRVAALTGLVPAGLLIPRVVTDDEAAAAAFFQSAIAAGHEGVVIKSLTAGYGAGRRGGDWIKVKPRHTLDLVVLAAEWGHGRRQGWLSNLHLGARDARTGGLVMLGKTFKGLTDALLTWQTGRLLELAEPPADPERRRGVVTVRPELVVEIAFDGVQASTRYPGGVTLRFARVLRYRDDKAAAEADTIDMVRDLWSGEPWPGDQPSGDEPDGDEPGRAGGVSPG
jgi:DNA ligase 1